MVRTGATVADACAEYLRYIAQDRQRKPSTLRDYDSIFRNHVLPHLGGIRLEDLTPERVERWAAHDIDPHRRLANRTREKSITVFHGVMERVRKLYRLPANPVADIEKPRFPGSAIRVRASWTNGHLTSPKSGRVRSVPMAPQVVEALARLSQRELLIDDDDVVFAGVTGGYLDGSALSKRYRAALQRAALRPLRFHDLRHTFGTRVIGVADIRRVQEWMGHANVQTTMQYLHYVPRPQDAALVGEAFATNLARRHDTVEPTFDASGQGRLV
jgi:integrase